MLQGRIGRIGTQLLVVCFVAIATVHGGAVAANQRLPMATIRALDQAIDEQMREQGLPGVVVAIRIPGHGSYVAARGKADLRTGRPRRLDDPFRIASITKTFVGTAVLQLVDAGKLKKFDKLAKWYPWFPNAHSITIDDLLRMRSGIADSFDKAFVSFYFRHLFADLDAEAAIRRAADFADRFTAPGGRTVYTNVNYLILERIVEKITGRSLGAQIEMTILRPLGLSRTLYPAGVGLPGPLHGYSFVAETGSFRDVTRLNPAVPGGAGAMISTLDDLHVYARAICRGGLLKPATQRARLRGAQVDGSPDFVRYGEGILRVGPFCGHDGTIFGFSTEMYYLPERDATIVVNVNRLDEDDVSKSTELFLTLAKILFPRLVDW
jgi:D-alanyl-D-alanine carboxypeptidase